MAGGYSLTKMDKPYSEMTPAERLADRIAKNREIDRRVKESQSAASKPASSGGKRKASSTATGSGGDALAEFQRIKKQSGIDAASEFVRSKSK